MNLSILRSVFVFILFLPTAGFSDTDYSTLSSEALVKLLQEPKSRIRAYHELSLRNNPKTEKTIEDFEDRHRNAELIVCPQRFGKLPIYAVLSDFLSHIEENTDSSNLKISAESPLAKKDKLLIEVFSSNGTKINPFQCNDNVLEGIMMDMNHDGFIERASQISFGVEGAKHVDVLKIERVEEMEERLLAVLYNWGEHDDWDYEFSDHENDGYIEVDFGPLTEAGIVPEVTIKWDNSKKVFVPSSVFHNHLIILDPAMVWTDLDHLKEKQNFFPPDPRALNESDRFYYKSGKLPPWKEKQQKAVSTLYVAKSLRGLSNEQIYQYMGRGRTLIDLENDESPRTTIPEKFWHLAPRDAAELILEANRSVEHKSKFKIVIGPAAHGDPPESYALAVSESAAHAMTFPNWFLRIDPKGSYLMYSSSTNRNHYMLRTIELRYQRPAYDFRICPVKYEDAKQVIQTIWWLREAAIEPAGKENDKHGLFSTADGDGTVQFISADGKDQSFVTADIGGWVSNRWDSSFEGEELVGLIVELFWDTWVIRADPCLNGTMDWASGEYAGNPNDKKVHESAQKFLKLFRHDQSQVSHAIVINAIRAVGDFMMTDLVSTLEEIKKSIPKSPGTSRCTDVDKEIDQLQTESKELPKLNPENTDDFFKAEEAKHDRLMTLYDEWNSIRHGAITECALQEILNAIDLSLRQIRLADNALALRSWINEKKVGWDWALWRLNQIDRTMYVELLTSWLPNANDEDKIDLLRLLFGANPSEAATLARLVKFSENPKLATIAFSVLADVGTSDEKSESLSVLLRFGLDPSTDTLERSAILNTLVPEKDPRKHPSFQIDDALLKMLDLPEGEYGSSNLTEVAEALTRRNGNKNLNEIMSRFNSDNIDYESIEFLEGIFPKMSESQKQDFVSKLRPFFDEGHGFLDEIATTAWVLNFGTLRSEIEEIATGNPDDIESDNCMGWTSSVDKVTGRCHRARAVAALWNENDPLTKAKMLISFFLQNPDEFAEIGVNRIEKLKSQLELIARLTKEEKNQLKEFLTWCDREHRFTEYDVRYLPERTDLFRFITSQCEL